MSAPATKAFSPAPVTIRPRIAESVSNRSNGSRNSTTSSDDSAFRLVGRFTVSNATPRSSTSNRMSWYGIMGSVAKELQLSRILAIHAHPDDVEILAGGTLALLARDGHEITVVTMTPGDCGSSTLPPD